MSALIVWLPGTNHPLAVGVAALITGVVAVLMVGVLDLVLPDRWRKSRFVWMVPGLAAGVLIGSQFMLTESRAFERAFLIAMPADVEGLNVEGYYVPESYGLRSNLWIGLLLDADRHQLEELLSQVPAGRNWELEELWAGDPDYVWGILFGGFVPQAGAAWQQPPLTDHIEIYQSEYERKEFTRILWDGVAERVYAFYMRT